MTTDKPLSLVPKCPHIVEEDISTPNEKVVEITSRQPHMTGKALCLACKNVWVAVTPTGTTELECPSCGLTKGVYSTLAFPDYLWKCNCGNYHFCISASRETICSYCGKIQTFNNLPPAV